jgi:hypothetical protein
MRRFAGTIFALSGVCFFLTGLLHPQGARGEDFHAAIVSMLVQPTWPAAHWFALVAAIVLAWSLSLIAGEMRSLAAIAGARLGIAAALFMAVEFAVELGARDEAVRFAAGERTPLLALVDPMQAVGWPALAIAFILFASGSRLTPRVVTVIGIIGAAALGIGGLVVQGLHVVALAPVFALGNGLALWIVWAGVALAREPETEPAAAS